MAIKYVTIRVKEGKYNPNGNGRVLLHDDANDWYYLTTMTDVTSAYDAKIRALEEKISSLEKETKESERRVRESESKFKSFVTEQYNSLLATVKDVNSKLIKLVQSDTEGE